MSLAILGVGTSLPPHAFTQAEAFEFAEQVAIRSGAGGSSMGGLFRKAGVSQRHTVLSPAQVASWLEASADPSGGNGRGPTTEERMKIYQDHAGPLALAAARSALESSRVAAREITHVITVSCTGFMAPGVDVCLMAGLGLPPTVQRTHVGFMGCHGALNGLRVAKAFGEADPAARQLLCAVELCTLHYRYGGEPEKLLGNVLFGDGAAALVSAAAPAGGGEGEGWRLRATGSMLFADSAGDMTWTIGDHGFEMLLSRRVPELIRGSLRPWLSGWLEANGVQLEAVRSWAVHPGGPRILTAVEQSLGLERGALDLSRQVLAECGNMSSPTVLFILDRLRRGDAKLPCVALGFGPGLVAEAALFA